MTIKFQPFDPVPAYLAAQQELAAEVARVEGQIITDGMSEQDKVVAINDYLVASAAYDYDALAALDRGEPETVTRALTASGILLDKTGVCSSYARRSRRSRTLRG